MDEAKIQQTLKQNIPAPAEHTPAAPTVSDPSLVQVHYDLDELTQYKLMQHFGENYKEGDQTARQQISYIYEAIADQIGSKDYPVVVAKINDLKRMLGLNHTDNARYKMYQWLKLDQKRSRIEQEQGVLING